jgi:hypothetical protein
MLRLSHRSTAAALSLLQRAAAQRTVSASAGGGVAGAAGPAAATHGLGRTSSRTQGNATNAPETSADTPALTELVRDFLDPKEFYNAVRRTGIDFFCGVPDSLLKDFCAYVTHHTPAHQHVITANEGNAVALAAGYHLATGKHGLVYLQVCVCVCVCEQSLPGRASEFRDHDAYGSGEH